MKGDPEGTMFPLEALCAVRQRIKPDGFVQKPAVKTVALARRKPVFTVVLYGAAEVFCVVKQNKLYHQITDSINMSHQQ